MRFKPFALNFSSTDVAMFFDLYTLMWMIFGDKITLDKSAKPCFFFYKL